MVMDIDALFQSLVPLIEKHCAMHMYYMELTLNINLKCTTKKLFQTRGGLKFKMLAR